MHVFPEHGGSRQEHTDIADAQNSAQLGRRVDRGKRHDEGSDPASRQPGHHPLEAVGIEDADPSSLANACCHHPPRQATRRDIGLKIGHPPAW